MKCHQQNEVVLLMAIYVPYYYIEQNGMTNVKKKEINFRLHIPLSIVN